jgi:UDP-2,3-diacylglucosamine pyrophosphatase LpxH
MTHSMTNEALVALIQPPQNAAEAAVATPHATQRYRTIWISDAHLGWRGSEAGSLLEFLKHHDAEHWYLVGDMVDGWMLKRTWHWPQAHNDIVQKLLRKVRKGARVDYIPGNHDEFLRDFVGLQFGGVTLLRDALHTTADGRKLWVLHGDEFDSIVHYAPWLAFIGNNGYDAMILIGRPLNRLRRWLGRPDWSLAAALKQRVKNVIKFVTDYEHALALEAHKRGADGVVCGHIHKAEIRKFEGIAYFNTGDWVESCTALVEHFDGRLEIIRWRGAPAPATLPAA